MTLSNRAAAALAAAYALLALFWGFGWVGDYVARGLLRWLFAATAAVVLVRCLRGERR